MFSLISDISSPAEGVFKELQDFFRENGYPDAVGVNVHSRGFSRPVSSLSPIKVHPATYRFGVSNILDGLPVDDGQMKELKDKRKSLGDAVQALNKTIDETQERIKQLEAAQVDYGIEYTSVVASGDEARADEIDEELMKIGRAIRRSKIVIDDANKGVGTLAPDILVFDCMIKGLDFRLKKEAFRKMALKFDDKLKAFASEFHAFRQAAIDAGLDYQVVGVDSDYSDRKMMIKVAKGLGLKRI